MLFTCSYNGCLDGMDCSNEVIELLFLGTVMQLYSEVGKYTQNVTTKRYHIIAVM